MNSDQTHTLHNRIRDSPTETHSPILAPRRHLDHRALGSFLMIFFEPAISTPDANGYFAQARLIAEQQRTWFETESALQYIPPHWLRTEAGRYFSKYPPGLPLIAAVAWWFAGPTAALMVNPIMASLTVLGLFLLCKNWIGDHWALLAAALMMLNPVANEQALWAFGHTGRRVLHGLGWCIVWPNGQRRTLSRTPSPPVCVSVSSRQSAMPKPCWGLAALVFVALHLKTNPQYRRSVFAGLIGAAIPISALCIRNHAAFGAVWKTGYSITNEQTGFGWIYFKDYALPYLQQLLAEGSGLVFGLGLVGLAVLCSQRATWKRGILLALLVVPTTVLYMAYYFPPDGASMRFLVPTLFVYPIAGVWLLKLLAVHYPRPAVAGAITLLLFTTGWSLPPALQGLERQERTNGALARATDVLKEHVEPGSIVIADGLIPQQLDFIGNWRLVDGAVLSQDRQRRPPPPTKRDGAPGPGPGRGVNQSRARYGNLHRR